MLTPLVVLLLAQVEVKVLPVQGGLAQGLEPRAANAHFVWLQVPFGGVTPGGGAALYRFDRRDGGVMPIAAASLLDREELFELPHLPRTWGDDQLIRTIGLVDGLGFHPFPGTLRARAATSNRALLDPLDGGSLELLERESGARRPLGAFITGLAFATPAGHFVVHGRTPDSGVGALFIAPDAGLRFLPDLMPATQLSRGVLSASSVGLVTEAGQRVGDRGLDPGTGFMTVVSAGDELRVTDGAGIVRVLETRLREIHFDRSVVGRDFVVFERANGPGFIIESLTTSGRFLNLRAPDGPRSNRGGRVRYDSLPLEVFSDGGVGPWVDEPCAWRPLSNGEYCVGDAGLLTRPRVGEASTTLTADLTVPEVLPAWDVVRGGPEEPSLLFGPGALVHRTDGVDTLSVGVGDVLLYEAGGRLVLANDGITLVDPSTRERLAFGFPLLVRPIPARRSWLATFPGCRINELSLDGTSREVAGACPERVVDTAGGALLVTALQSNPLSDPWRSVLWRDPVRGTFEPIVPELQVVFGRFELGVVRGDLVWLKESSMSVHLVDARAGQVLRRVEGPSLEVTPLGLLYESRSGLTWEALDGGTFPVLAEASAVPRPQTKVGAGAVWRVGVLVQVTTGGAPALLESVNGREWTDAEAIATSLVNVRDGGLDVLDVDGGQRSFELRAFDSATVRRFGERLWFTGWDEAHGFEPWFFDGTTPRLAADVLPGPASSFPHFVGSFDRGVVVQATRTDGFNGAVALMLDPPAERLPPLPAPPPGGCGCGVVDLTSLAGLFVVARFRRKRHSLQRSR